jgi:peptidyl-prolyl cis-trans isomerase SurA
MKTHKKFLLIIVAAILLNNFSFPEVIEKIYAVINDEIITLTELKNFEQGMVASLREEYQGEELKKQIEESKQKLLDSLIDRKLLLSKAKEQNYNVEQYLENVIKEIMNKNNFSTKEQLKRALIASGIEYEDWRKFQMDELMTQSLIQNQIGARIIVENAEIMEHYRKNVEQYTKPAEMSLNCIFLNKQNYFIESALADKKNEISAKLNDNQSEFVEVAKEYSELPGEDNNFFLGKFKQGELDAKLESAALKIKKGKISSWIETESGWYLIQLKDFTESQLIQLKTVREEIERVIKNKKMQVKIKDYITQLRKDSHIKIYHEYK